jgi:hypothetical protein
MKLHRDWKSSPQLRLRLVTESESHWHWHCHSGSGSESAAAAGTASVRPEHASHGERPQAQADSPAEVQDIMMPRFRSSSSESAHGADLLTRTASAQAAVGATGSLRVHGLRLRVMRLGASVDLERY